MATFRFCHLLPPFVGFGLLDVGLLDEREVELLVGKVVLFESFSAGYSALFREKEKEYVAEKLSNNTTLPTSRSSSLSFFSHDVHIVHRYIVCAYFRKICTLY